MSLTLALKVVLKAVRLMSVAGVAWFSGALSAAAQDTSARLAAINGEEFQSYFGVNLFEAALGPKAIALAFALQDRSRDDLRPPPPVLIERDVLPPAFGLVHRPGVPLPFLIRAGDAGEPSLSPLDCAQRAHARHNLAFRCNAPVALNVPGGDSPRASFLREMEAETGMRIGIDIWPGDKDGLTGDRLLSARDVVTGMRFTLRYLDQRGFTLGAHPCSNRDKWRWSYVCLDDADWDRMSRAAQCAYVVENLLSVEGGSRTWSFAPLPGPKVPQGAVIAIGYSQDPRKIQTPAALCEELAAQEAVDDRLAAFLSRFGTAGGGLKRLGLIGTSGTAEADLSLVLSVAGKAQLVARFRAADPAALPPARAALEAGWRALGGARLCLLAHCGEVVRVALPPLPLYRPAAPRLSGVSPVSPVSPASPVPALPATLGNILQETGS